MANLMTRLQHKLPPGLMRFLFNLWPPFRGAKIKVDYISPDYRIFKTSMKLGLLNRNNLGVHFGGSLFAMTDPFFLVILTKNLGYHYVVWDKAATIEFKKPGRGLVSAHCEMSQQEITDIRARVDQSGKYVFDRSVDVLNTKNEVVATITKTIYVKTKHIKKMKLSA